MQEQHLFEYAVVRVVPQVEREEFINIGVVLYCARKKFLEPRFLLDEQRLGAFSCKLDIELVKAYVNAFSSICIGTASTSPIARLPIAERFRWLTATRSTIIQTSKIHPGLCSDPAAALQRLYNEMVL